LAIFCLLIVFYILQRKGAKKPSSSSFHHIINSVDFIIPLKMIESCKPDFSAICLRSELPMRLVDSELKDWLRLWIWFSNHCFSYLSCLRPIHRGRWGRTLSSIQTSSCMSIMLCRPILLLSPPPRPLSLCFRNTWVEGWRQSFLGIPWELKLWDYQSSQSSLRPHLPSGLLIVHTTSLFSGTCGLLKSTHSPKRL